MVPLKYLSNFLRTLEMSLINCKISLAAVNQELTFTTTDTKLYIPAVTLSTQDNVKLLKQLDWNQVLKKQLIGISINLK